MVATFFIEATARTYISTASSTAVSETKQYRNLLTAASLAQLILLSKSFNRS